MVFKKPQPAGDKKSDPSIEVTSVKGGDPEAPVNLDSKSFDGEIYVMPREFFVGGAKKKSSSKTLVIVLIVALVLFAFGIASLYVFVFQNNETPVVIEPEPIENVDEIIPEEIPTTTEEIIPEEIPTTTEEIIPEESEETLDVFPFLPLLPESLDLDEDGLTDVEESLLGTEEQVADTDGDSFLDGAELVAGFDPTQAGVDLTDSALFQTYENEDPIFSVRLPAAWTLTEESTDDTKIFLAANGDTITLELFTNVPPFTLTKWLEDTYPGTDVSAFSQTAFDAFVGLEAQNGRQVLINIGSHVIVATYETNGKDEAAYPAIWEFILRSFSAQCQSP